MSQVRDLQIGAQEHVVTRPLQTLTQLEAFDAGRLEAPFIVHAGRDERGAPNDAISRSEVRAQASMLLLTKVEQEIPILGEKIWSGRLSVVCSRNRVESRVLAKDFQGQRQRIPSDHDVGVEECDDG